MSDLLTPGRLDRETYYRASAQHHKSYPAIKGDAEADICIVGAGLTGLSAALELAKAGRKVIVLDAGSIAYGASGRNGGQICTGFSPGMGKFEELLGNEAAKACFAMAQEAVDLIRHRVRDHNIDCDLKWGYLICANKPSHMKELEHHGEEYARYGHHEWRMLDKDQLQKKLASPMYYGCLQDDTAGHMQPLDYALGLARAADDSGAVIHENSRVISIDEKASGVSVKTWSGTVKAKQVIVACNAYLGQLVPGLNGRVMPVASYVITTAKMSETRAKSLIQDDEAVGDCNFVTDYFRLTADKRLLFGGRCSYSGIHPKDLARNMRPRMLKVFPQLADIEIDYAWGGHIGITYNRLPDVGRIGSNLYFAQGYSGQGVALTGLFGKLMAEAVMGDSERFDVFSQIKHMPFPGGVLRRPALTLGMLYYRLRDLLA